ncbi:MAG: universal stress protein [Desulfobacteraceae bacterium]|nr:MAG: universal stress protein [Desulfobacteraceae bacterium]
MEKKMLRILIAYDGSEMAQNAVQYIAEYLPEKQTEVVLLYIQTEVPDAFWNMEKEMDFRYKSSDIRACIATQHIKINECMGKATRILMDAGFPEGSINKKIQIKKVGIARDIIKESQNGYDAVVIGRNGDNKLKDILVGSIPSKLLGKIQGIPLIVVGGAPKKKKILVAFDGSKEVMRGVKHLSRIMCASDCKMTLCHVVRSQSIFQKGDEKQWQESEQKRMEPLITESKQHLVDAGFPFNQITCEVIRNKVSRASGIIEKAMEDNYGTIVIGRRGLTIIKEFFLGRVGKKIFQLAGDLTVWIVR